MNDCFEEAFARACVWVRMSVHAGWEGKGGEERARTADARGRAQVYFEKGLLGQLVAPLRLNGSVDARGYRVAPPCIGRGPVGVRKTVERHSRVGGRLLQLGHDCAAATAVALAGFRISALLFFIFHLWIAAMASAFGAWAGGTLRVFWRRLWRCAPGLAA